MKSFKEMAKEAQSQANFFKITDSHMKVIFNRIALEILELIGNDHELAFLKAVEKLRKMKENETTEN